MRKTMRNLVWFLMVVCGPFAIMSVRAEASEPAFNGEFEAGKALKAILGTYSEKNACSQWIPGEKERAFLPGGEDAEIFETRSLLWETVASKPSPIILQVFSTTFDGNQGHCSEVAMGFAEWHRKGKTWVASSVSLMAVACGNWGDSPPLRVIKLGPEKSGILLENGSTGQGCTDVSGLLWARTGTTFREVLNIEKYAGDDEGAVPVGGEHYSFQTSMKPLPDHLSREGFWGLEVRTFGSRPVEKQPSKNFDEVKRFEFNGGVYVPRSEPIEPQASKSKGEGAGRMKFLMKKMRVPHCKRGPSRCDICRGNDQEKWCLLDVDPPDKDMVQRPVVEFALDGNRQMRVFDVIKSFGTEEEARQFLAKNEYPGLIWDK